MSHREIHTTLGALACSYGVPLERGLDGLEDTPVRLWRERLLMDSEPRWHVSAENGVDLTDAEWAPCDDAHAEGLRSTLARRRRRPMARLVRR